METQNGLAGLKVRVKARGLHAIDGRSGAARAISQWRAALVSDLGGELDLSAQQKTLVDLASRTQLLLAHCDSYLLSQQSVINKRKRAFIPLVGQRQALADGLVRILTTLGLGRAEKRVEALASYISKAKDGAA